MPGIAVADGAATLIWAARFAPGAKQLIGYFELPITNGFTEGCLTKFKLLKRIS